MEGLLIGYARVSTDEKDLTAQREALASLGVSMERMYVDHGLTGTNRDRPGLREALAACRAGDTLVVTKLDRLARSRPDARAIVEASPAARSSSASAVRCTTHRPRRSAPVQRLGHGRRVRGRSHPHAHSRGDARGSGQGSPPRQAAKAERAPGGPPGRPPRSGRAQHGRAERPVRRHPLDGLPGPADGRDADLEAGRDVGGGQAGVERHERGGQSTAGLGRRRATPAASKRRYTVAVEQPNRAAMRRRSARTSFAGPWAAATSARPSTGRWVPAQRHRDRRDQPLQLRRYNAILSNKDLLAAGFTNKRERKDIRKLDGVKAMEQLRAIGRSVGEKVDVPRHFHGFVDGR